jgi:hypothetical protein
MQRRRKKKQSTCAPEIFKEVGTARMNRDSTFLDRLGADISMKVLCGGDWSILADYWGAVIGAGLLEGQVYAIYDPNGKIITMSVWFEPGKAMFATYVTTK